MKVLYEDNHIIIVDKAPGEIVQGDKTGDEPLVETIKQWLKEKYNKPGNVFCGVVHRLDRPVGGVVVFAKTSKALARMNEMFRTGKVHKTYLTSRAIIRRKMRSASLATYIRSNVTTRVILPLPRKPEQKKLRWHTDISERQTGIICLKYILKLVENIRYACNCRQSVAR